MKKLQVKKMNVGMYIVIYTIMVAAVMAAIMVALFELGLLHPRKLPLTLESVTLEKEYDGAPLLGSEYEIVRGELAEGHRIKVLSKTKLSEVGECIYKIEVIICDPYGIDVTEMYDLEVKYGKLTVNKRELTVSVDSDEKIYDGEPLSASPLTILKGTLPYGMSIETFYDDEPIITNVGEKSLSYDVVIKDLLGRDVTENFDIKASFPTLTVYKRPVSLCYVSEEKVYDGAPLYSPTWKQTGGMSIAKGQSVVLSDFPSITYAGKVVNTGYISIIDEKGNNVTDQYELTVEEGMLTVNRGELIFKTESDSKVYDGKPLTNKGWSASVLSNGHKYNVIPSSGIAKVGETENIPIISITDGSGRDVSDQFEIYMEPGRLNVERRPITFTTGSSEIIYDGNALSNSDWSVSENGLCEGHVAKVELKESITKVGKVKNTPTISIFDEKGEDVTNQYEIKIKAGTLTVNKRTLMIKTESRNKVYDGSPLSCEEWSISDGTLCEDHRISFQFTSKPTKVGKYNNSASVAIYDQAGNNVTDQYDLKITQGTLEVTPIIIYVSTATQRKTYDGIALSSYDWDITSGTVGIGHKLEVISGASVYRVGSVLNKLTFVVKDEAGQNITDQYVIEQSCGILYVEPRKISIKTGSAEKRYDGKDLTSDECTLIGGSLCAGEGMGMVGARRKSIGVSENVPVDFFITDSQENDVTDCYMITFSYGTLTVNP